MTKNRDDTDRTHMLRAVEVASLARTRSSPNPWVGCVLVPADGDLTFEGATEAPGGLHAEAAALLQAGRYAKGATAYVTLEPCSHRGRTPSCAEALINAGVRRVVAAVRDPDRRIRGRGFDLLRDAGIEVVVGVGETEVSTSLAPYLKHRQTGRPWVVLKLAATVDGRIAAPDGSSRWITGAEARKDAHRLRAESDAILVGAGTVRADDPELTTRDVDARDPLRVVLGVAARDARVQPALELSGDLGDVLDTLGAKDVLQLLVEGGAHVAYEFHRQGLVDRYVIYFAPALFGGSDSLSMFAGKGASDMSALWRGEFVGLKQLGSDLRIDLQPLVKRGVADVYRDC